MALAREGAAQQCSFGQFYQHQQKLRESSVAKAKGVYCSGKDCYSPFPSQWEVAAEGITLNAELCQSRV